MRGPNCLDFPLTICGKSVCEAGAAPPPTSWAPRPNPGTGDSDVAPPPPVVTQPVPRPGNRAPVRVPVTVRPPEARVPEGPGNGGGAPQLPPPSGQQPSPAPREPVTTPASTRLVSDRIAAPMTSSLLVTFARNSSSISQTDRNRIANFARSLGTGAVIEVVGYASTDGTLRRNMQLSQERADAVAGVIAQATGARPASAVGRGPVDVITFSDGREDRTGSRRVVVYSSAREVPPEAPSHWRRV